MGVRQQQLLGMIEAGVFPPTGPIKTIYRVEREVAKGKWETAYTFHEKDTGEVAESWYNTFREDYPNETFRLVRTTDHVVRVGRGRVYE
jgi:hypothetical protein